jgi:transcriptional regulator with XRE-family HTH domain
MSEQAKPAEIPVGERVRFFREASKRTQVSIAARAGISVDYLYQIERGLKVPSMPVLYRLASILGVPVSALFSEPDFGTETPGAPWAPALARAMVDFGTGQAPPEPPDLAALRDRLHAIHATWQESLNRYSDTAPHVPELVRDIGYATRAYQSAGEANLRREAFRLAADLYLLVRPVAKYLGRPDLALMAGDRGVLYAEAADDPVRVGIAKWNLAQALSANNEPENVEHLALMAVDELSPETRREGPSQVDASAVLGILQLMAAIAQVRQSDPWGALSRIRSEALPIAQRLGETNSFWTVFGPANVTAYQVAVLAEAGEAADALRTADELDLSQLRSVERRASHLLAVARAHEARGDDAAVLLTLLRLEREAPEDLRYRGTAHDLVRGILHRVRPTFAPDVRELAGRMGLFA